MSSAPRPGYLVVHTNEGGTYIGGLMVTDDHGLPLDFRYTDPITPTRLQRALYGGALDRYLRADVVAATLLKAVGEQPTMLVVDDERMLGTFTGPCPTAALTGTNLPPLGDRGQSRPEQNGTVLVQLVDGSSPVRLSVDDASHSGAITSALVTLGERMDPLEPAERVRAALELIAVGEVA